MGGINTVKSIHCIVKNIKPRTGLQNLVRDRYLLRVFNRWKMLSLFFMEENSTAGSQTLVNNVYSLSPEIIFNIVAGSRRIETEKNEKGFYTFREINSGEGTGPKAGRKAGQGDDQRADRGIGLRTDQKVDRGISPRADQKADLGIGPRTDQNADLVTGPGTAVSISTSEVNRIRDSALPVLFFLTVPGAGSTILYKSAADTIQRLLKQGAAQPGEFAQIEPGSGKKDSLQVRYHNRMMIINSLRNKYLKAVTEYNVINHAAPIISDIRYLFSNGEGQSLGQLRGEASGEIGSIRPKDERYDMAGNVIHSELTLREEKGSLTGIKGSLTGIRGPLTGIRDPLTGIRDPLAGTREPLTGIKGPDEMVLRQERAEVSYEDFRTDKALVNILSRHLAEWNRVSVNRLPYEKISRYTTAGSIVYRESGEKLPGEGKLFRDAAKGVADNVTKAFADEDAKASTDKAAKAAKADKAAKAAKAVIAAKAEIAARTAKAAAGDGEKAEAREIAADAAADNVAADDAKGTVFTADHDNWDDVSVEYQLRQDANESQLRKDSRGVPVQAQRGETSQTSPQTQSVPEQHMFVQNFARNLILRAEKASPNITLLSRLSKTASDSGKSTADSGLSTAETGKSTAETGKTDNTIVKDLLLSTVMTSHAGSARLVDRLLHNVLGTFTQKQMERYLAVKELLERRAGTSSDENDLVQSYSSFKAELENVKNVFLLKAPGKAADEAPDINPDFPESAGKSETVSEVLTAEKRILKGYREKHSRISDIVKHSDIMKHSDMVKRFNIIKRSEVMKKKMTDMVFHLDKGLGANFGKESGAAEIVMLAPPAVAQGYDSAYSRNLPPITYMSEELFSKARQQRQQQPQLQQPQQPQQLQQLQQLQQTQQQQQPQPVIKSLNTPVEISPKTVRHTISDVDLMNPAELNKLVDKVYSQLETRLSRERRRFGY